MQAEIHHIGTYATIGNFFFKLFKTACLDDEWSKNTGLEQLLSP